MFRVLRQVLLPSVTSVTYKTETASPKIYHWDLKSNAEVQVFSTAAGLAKLYDETVQTARVIHFQRFEQTIHLLHTNKARQRF